MNIDDLENYYFNEYNNSSDNNKQKINTNGRPKTSEIRKDAIKSYLESEKFTYREISEIFQCSTSTIYNIKKEMENTKDE